MNIKAFNIAYNTATALASAVAFVIALAIFITSPLGFWLGLAYVIAILANLFVFGDCIYDIVVELDEA